MLPWYTFYVKWFPPAVFLSDSRSVCAWFHVVELPVLPILYSESNKLTASERSRYCDISLIAGFDYAWFKYKKTSVTHCGSSGNRDCLQCHHRSSWISLDKVILTKSLTINMECSQRTRREEILSVHVLCLTCVPIYKTQMKCFAHWATHISRHAGIKTWSNLFTRKWGKELTFILQSLGLQWPTLGMMQMTSNAESYKKLEHKWLSAQLLDVLVSPMHKCTAQLAGMSMPWLNTSCVGD